MVVGFKRHDFDISIDSLGIHLDDIISRLPEDFTPDCLVVLDDSGPPWFTGLESTALPSVFLSVDTHHHFAWHINYSRCFDHVLVAHKKYLTAEYALHPHTEWFPLWAMSVPPEAETRDIDVAFRGTLDPSLHPHRAEWLEELSRYVSCDADTGRWDECYPRAKVVINQNVSDDLNFRNFEAMVSGALLFSPQFDNGLLDLFTAGEDLICYDQAIEVEKLAQLISFYLSNEPLRKKIAESGQAKVISSHTVVSRAKRLADLLSSLKKRAFPGKHICSLRSLHMILSLLYQDGDKATLKEVTKRMNALLGEVISRGELSRGESEDQRDSFLCLWFLYEAELFDTCAERAKTLREYDPANAALFGIYEIGALIALNREAEGKELAQILSTSADEFLASVPEMLALARRSLEATFSK